jgi:decaprenyl-phosphate phosphoribosyltransferase
MRIIAYWKLLRPAQWVKNLMLFFPAFLAGDILLPGVAIKGVAAVAIFSCGSSATYILNDLLDRENDLHHPKKCQRPLASGKVSPVAAAILSSIFAAVSVAAAFGFFSNRFGLFLGAYLLISAGYSVFLKHHALFDVFCIASGFLLRLSAGGEASNIRITEWLFLSVFLLSLFLSTGKRLSEKEVIGNGADSHRKSLGQYPAGFLDGTMYMAAGTVLVTYTMYTITRPGLVYTVPLCTFGLLRYLLLVKSGGSGDPTEALLKDRLLFCVGILWVFMVGWGIYGR